VYSSKKIETGKKMSSVFLEFFALFERRVYNEYKIENKERE